MGLQSWETFGVTKPQNNNSKTQSSKINFYQNRELVTQRCNMFSNMFSNSTFLLFLFIYFFGSYFILNCPLFLHLDYNKPNHSKKKKAFTQALFCHWTLVCCFFEFFLYFPFFHLLILHGIFNRYIWKLTFPLFPSLFFILFPFLSFCCCCFLFNNLIIQLAWNYVR